MIDAKKLLEGEVKRLRGALEQITKDANSAVSGMLDACADLPKDSTAKYLRHVSDNLKWGVEDARAALAAPEEGKE